MRRSYQFLVVSLILSAATLTGFGSSGGVFSATPVAGAALAVSSSKCVSEAQQMVSSAEQSSTLRVPTIHNGVKRLAGKNVWFITDTTVSTFAEQQAGFDNAMKKVGINPTTYNSQSSVTSENGGIQEAIGAHANMIVLDGVATDQVSNELGDAAAAGIPVVSLYELPTTAAAKKAIKATIYLDGAISGRAMTAYAIAKTGCEMNAAFIYNPAFSVNTTALTATKSLIAKLCPSTCHLVPEQYNISSWSTTAGPLVVSTLSSHPDVNSVIFASDYIASPVIAALSASNKTPLLVGEGGTTPLLQMIAAGGALKADVASSSNDLVGWTAADTVLRLLSHQQVAPSDAFLTRLLVKANTSSNPADSFPTNYVALFTKAWGVPG